MPSRAPDQDSFPTAGPAPAEFVLGAAARAVSRDPPELADALRALDELHADLRVEASRFRAMVERVPAVVYIADAGSTGRWHYVSPQVEAILGFTPEEWTANPSFWMDRLHPDDRAAVLEEETEAIVGTPGKTASEYRMMARDGRVVWIRDDAVLVSVDGGEPNWHGVMSDITDRKEAE